MCNIETTTAKKMLHPFTSKKRMKKGRNQVFCLSARISSPSAVPSKTTEYNECTSRPVGVGAPRMAGARCRGWCTQQNGKGKTNRKRGRDTNLDLSLTEPMRKSRPMTRQPIQRQHSLEETRPVGRVGHSQPRLHHLHCSQMRLHRKHPKIEKRRIINHKRAEYDSVSPWWIQTKQCDHGGGGQPTHASGHDGICWDFHRRVNPERLRRGRGVLMRSNSMTKRAP